MKTICRLCGKSVFEIRGYLHRVNEKGVPGIWECRPSCNADLTQDEALLAAVDGTPKNCQADRDGECIHPDCPQIRDGEPEKTGRHCPLDHYEDEP